MLDLKIYPRLTGSLRAHSDVAEKVHYRGDLEELRRRRRTEKSSSNELGWNEIQEIFQAKASKNDVTLKEFRKKAIEFGSFEDEIIRMRSK